MFDEYHKKSKIKSSVFSIVNGNNKVGNVFWLLMSLSVRVCVRAWVCLSVRPERCEHNILKILDIFSPNFQHWYILGQDESFKFEVKKGRSSRSQLRFNMPENALLDLLARYLKHNRRNFTRLWLLVCLRPKKNCLDFEGRGVKVKVTARSYVKNLGPHIS